MSNEFSDLMKNLSDDTDFESLQKKLESTKSNYQEDERFWKPSVNKDGNGYAVVRFLPRPEGESNHFVKYWDHYFQGPTGQWYVDMSLTTLNQPDPVSEYNKQLWSTGIDANKEIARRQKRKLNYVANVYIIKDSEHPENEGKVKLWRFGKKIFDKIDSAIDPEFDTEIPINPFNPFGPENPKDAEKWAEKNGRPGADFILKAKTTTTGNIKFRSYDDSRFATVGPMEPEFTESLWKQEHSLEEIVSPDKFKSYDQLREKLMRVIGQDPLGSVNRPKINEFQKEETIENTLDNDVPFDTDDDSMEDFEKLLRD